ncbi:MAG: SRPBCC family protein [Actinomycetota bacterium]
MNDTLQINASGERDIVMTREFDAPRELVWDAWTKPELLKRWLGVRGGWTFPVCEVDLVVGGKYRWVWRGPDGTEMGVSGEYREIVAPERLVATEEFDDAWYEGDCLNTIELTERDGRTTVTTTMHLDNATIRDGVLAGPMAGGVSESYDVLAQVLADEQR